MKLIERTHFAHLPTAVELLPRLSEALRPGARLQEAAFVLRYLIKGGIDVRKHCRPEIDYVLANLYPDGAPIEEHSGSRYGWHRSCPVHRKFAGTPQQYGDGLHGHLVEPRRAVVSDAD